MLRHFRAPPQLPRPSHTHSFVDKKFHTDAVSQQRLASVAMSAQPTDRQQEPVGTVEHTSWEGGCTANSPLPSYPHPSLKKEKKSQQESRAPGDGGSVRTEQGPLKYQMFPLFCQLSACWLRKLSKNNPTVAYY